jgi:hypothetical protein
MNRTEESAALPAMNAYLKFSLFFLMLSAFIFGYFDLFFQCNLERLHIFLFNLSSGGFVILFFTEIRWNQRYRSVIFLFISVIYALCALLELYTAVIVISIVLAVIVEIIRIRAFSFFPKDFFRGGVAVSEKFHQASLLCISLALIISSFVILNNEFFRWFYLPKLKIEMFFLGYSFPLSLITMAVMFRFVTKRAEKTAQWIENISFWVINLGVILFFVFIIFELFIAEIVAAGILSISVIVIFIYFIRNTMDIQQKKFLTSGMCFLASTAISGILYIVAKYFPAYESSGECILRMHSFLSLYGWNISGLFIIIRWNDFPLKLNTMNTILFHWIVILILAPLGEYYCGFAMAAIALYGILLYIFFRSR